MSPEIDGAAASYEAIPYLGSAVPSACPDAIAVRAAWCGGSVSPVRGVRVAELGCGDGANLLPLAFYDRSSSYVGIDASPGHLDRARAVAQRIGLQNVDWVLRDVRNLGPTDCGPYDFVIAHGIYSWVPEDARDAILRFCASSLTTSGYAYISFNSQPGWATRRVVREALLRSRGVREAGLGHRATKAIGVAAEFIEDLPSRDYAFAVLLEEELKRVHHAEPFYVAHEYLAEVNEGFWLGDFVERACRHGLRYVGDAQFCRPEGQVPVGLMARLAARGLTRVEQEETVDLLCNRNFHMSLLCRTDAPRGRFAADCLPEELHVATSLRALSQTFDLTDGVVERFIGEKGVNIEVDESIVKAALVSLALQWPHGMQLGPVYEQAVKLLRSHGCGLQKGACTSLQTALVKLFEKGEVDFRFVEPTHVTTAPQYPQAHSLARFEAEAGKMLTTAYHVPLALQSDARAFVCALNGSHSHQELRQTFAPSVVDGTLPILERWGLLVT